MRIMAKKSVLLVALVGAIAMGSAVRVFAASCSGSCGSCTLSFTNCTSCSINEGACTWEYEGCSGVNINCGATLEN